MARALGELTHALVGLAAPAGCAACGDPMGALEQHPFCSGCRILLEPAPVALRPPNPAAAPHVYCGPLAEAIAALKYRARADLGGPLGRLLASHAAGYAGVVDAVLPMPLHPSRLRERGYNQAALLAAPVARCLGVPLVTGVLGRARATIPQASLPRARRGDNVRGAFTVRAAVPARVLLVDDVRTTGATLTEGARTLTAAGCSAVRTLALARAPG